MERPRLSVCSSYAFLFGIVLLVGCQVDAKHYTLTGEVLSKNPASDEISVDAAAIQGFMPAMNMNYRVNDPRELEKIQPGERITADVVVKDHDHYWLEHLTVSDRSTISPISAARTAYSSAAAPGVPNIPMVNQDGKRLHLSDFRGKAVLLTFIYTRCPMATMCPLISSEFAAIHRSLAKAPSLYQKTHLLSVSLDPAYDTAPVLRRYGLAYLKDDPSGFAQWDFVSTKPSDLDALASSFDVLYFPQGNQISHSMSTVLLAPDGSVKKTWFGNEWKTSEVLSALKAAASGTHD